MNDRKALFLTISISLMLPIAGTHSGEGDVWLEGILRPLDGHGVCDWGQTHVLLGPCTGDYAWLYGPLGFDCEYVLVEGPDVTPVEYCPLTVLVESITQVSPPCLVQVRDLIVEPRGAPFLGQHRLDWMPFGCADSYDVIRGTVSGLTTRDLGAVTCLANDVGESQLNDLGDDEPSPDETFFYLVRPNGPTGYPHYGYSSSGSVRSPAGGDCP